MQFVKSILFLSMFTTGVLSHAAIGWAPYVEVQRSESTTFQDVDTAPSYEDESIKVGTEGFIRSSEGQLAFDGSYTRLGTSWSGNSVIPGENVPLFDDVDILSASAMWTHLGRDAWGYSILLGLESARAAESPFDKADFSDALAFTLGGSVNYRVRPDLVLGFGLLYASKPADIDENWIPILQVYWKINEQLTLQTRNGVLLTWTRPEERLREWTFSALWKSREWHLGEAGSEEMGYEEEGLSLGIAYALELLPGFTVEPQVEYLFAREATVWQGGGKLIQSDLESTWRYGVKLAYSF